MKRPIHPLILRCHPLNSHAAYLPHRGQVEDGAMLRFRMDDTLSGELSAASAEYIVQDAQGQLVRHNGQITSEQSQTIISRFSDRGTDQFEANGALDRCLDGAGTMKPGFPDPFITME